MNLQGVQENFCFFTIHCNPSPSPTSHRCKRPSKLSTQFKCTVTPFGWYFFVQPITAECWRERGGTLSRILGKKNTIFTDHPVVTWCSFVSGHSLRERTEFVRYSKTSAAKNARPSADCHIGLTDEVIYRGRHSPSHLKFAFTFPV